MRKFFSSSFLLLSLSLCACLATHGQGRRFETSGEPTLLCLGRSEAQPLAVEDSAVIRRINLEVRRADVRVDLSSVHRSEVLRFFDGAFLAAWLDGQGRTVLRQRLVDGQELILSLCAYEKTALRSEFRLGKQPARDSAGRPTFIAQGTKNFRWLPVHSGVTVISGTAGADSIMALALADTIAQLERVTHSTSVRPVYLVLVSDTAELARVFPIRYSDGNFRDFSLQSFRVGSMSFIARQQGHFPIHELVHVALASREFAASNETDPLLYFFTEALARALGGSEGISFGLLPDHKRSVEDVRELLNRHSDSTLAHVRFSADRNIMRDVVGALQRAVIRSCHVTPRGMLEFTDRDRFGRVVQVATEVLNISASAIAQLVVDELRSTSNLLAEINQVSPNPRCMR